MNTLLSAFGGGLWIVPLLVGVGALIFTYLGFRASQSGDALGKIPFLKTGYGILAVFAWVAFIGILIWINAEK